MIEELIEKLKANVADLVLIEDAVLFDKRMAEIDLLIYNIRTQAFQRKPARTRQDMSQWDKKDMDYWLDDLVKEMENGT